MKLRAMFWIKLTLCHTISLTTKLSGMYCVSMATVNSPATAPACPWL